MNRSAITIGSRVRILDAGPRKAILGATGRIVGSWATLGGEFWPESGLRIELDAEPADGLGIATVARIDQVSECAAREPRYRWDFSPLGDALDALKASLSEEDRRYLYEGEE